MNKKAVAAAVAFLALLVICTLFIYRIVASGPKPAARITAPAITQVALDDRVRLFAKANEMTASGELIKARDTLRRIIEKFPDWNEISKVQEALDNVNIAILFSPIETPDSLSTRSRRATRSRRSPAGTTPPSNL